MKQMHIVPLSTQAMQILEELHPYSADEFRNLFLCEFVDDTQSVFRLADLGNLLCGHGRMAGLQPHGGPPAREPPRVGRL